MTSRALQDVDKSGFTDTASWASSAAPSGQESVEHRADVIVRHICTLPAHTAEECITYLLSPQPIKKRMIDV